METRRDFIKGAFTAGLLAPAIDANAQGKNSQAAASQGTGLSEEQQKTIDKLRTELCGLNPNPARQNNINATLENLPPMCVGRHIVFSKQFPKKIGGNFLTQKEFEQWRDNADRVYGCYKDLIGQTPKTGEKVLVKLQSMSTYAGWARNGYNEIAYSDDFNTTTTAVKNIKDSGCDLLMLHELAHIFANQRPWEAEPESLANLMTAYVLEHQGEYINNIIWDNKSYSGKQFRKEMFSKAEKSHKITFAYEDETVYDYYLFGLVDTVGWEAYRKAFRSYDDGSIPPPKYQGPKNVVAAFDFFERLVKYSGKESDAVLSSLPDEGKLFKKHFIKPIEQAQTSR